MMWFCLAPEGLAAAGFIGSPPSGFDCAPAGLLPAGAGWGQLLEIPVTSSIFPPSLRPVISKANSLSVASFSRLIMR